MVYMGDCKNNVTYDIMRAAAVIGEPINSSFPL